MQSKTIKLTIISFLTLFSIFFINIDGVKADCSCYYSAMTANYANADMYTQEMVFAEVSYGVDHRFVKRSCVSTENGTTSNGRTQLSNLVNGCNSIDVPFDNSKFQLTLDEAKSIYKQGCSIDACNQANISVTTSGKKTLITTNEGTKLTAKSKDSWEQAIEARDNLEENESNENDIEGILNWGSIAEEGQYTSSDVGSECNSISPIAEMLHNILWIVNVVAIIILIIMTVVDFVRVITGSEEDTMKKAFSNLIKRAVTIVILLLLPIIIGMILNILNQEGTVQIGSDGQPFCDVTN